MTPTAGERPTQTCHYPQREDHRSFTSLWLAGVLDVASQLVYAVDHAGQLGPTSMGVLGGQLYVPDRRRLLPAGEKLAA